MLPRSTWPAIAAGLTVIAATAVALPAQAAPAEPTPARYLVRTDSAHSAADVARDLRRSGADVGHVYATVLPGLSARLTTAQVRTLRSQGSVESVTPDPVFHSTTVQKNPTWGLDRIDQRTLTGSTSYRYDTTGRGVTAFVVDTGIRMGHSQFGSRALSGTDLVDHDDDASDCEGHGTHVAGTVGGSTYGVAKSVTLVGVRVLDCEGSGYASDIIAGLDWVVGEKPSGPAVVNLSLGGDPYPPLDDAVERTVAAGVPVVVAAGNDDVNACQQSPARAPHALTVAATDSKDRRAPFSNFGSCVDLFAPGVAVRSASNASNSASEVLSGTSMAAPHVTGAVARYLQAHPHATPAQTATALTTAATAHAVLDRAGSPDRLLYAAGPVVAPGAPSKVKASKSDKAKSAKLSWSAPVDDGGSPVTGYRVTRNGKDAKGKGPASVTVSAKTTSHTFAKLRKGSAYTLTVRAVTAAGAGPVVSKAVAKLR